MAPAGGFIVNMGVLRRAAGHGASVPCGQPTHEFGHHVENSALDKLLTALATDGIAHGDDLFDPALVAQLRAEAEALWQAQGFRPAAVGGARTRHAEIRGDLIHWWDAPHTAAQAQYLAHVEGLRQQLNARFLLGAFDFECHYALYPPGTHYARHLDRLRATEARVATCILYLNEGWREADGGALEIYADATAATPQRVILPQAGRLVCFFTDRLWHAVAPATRPRMSLTGWLRLRGQ